VALKFLIGGDEALERRFLHEARAQARVDHPNVCKVYEVALAGEAPYIAMQFIGGKTLRDLLPQLSLAEKLGIVRDVALALQAAHGQGLVHRDVKPANILVEPGPRPFITDFGLARDLAAPGETVHGTVIGTPQYMAPEQARSDKLDGRTDVYSLGATLYEALAGRPPFDGGAPLQILYKMLHEDPVPPPAPPEVQSIVLKCLEKDPARRYQSAKELADDLQRALHGEPVSAAPPPRAYARALRKVRKNPWLAVALLALGATLLAPRIAPLFRRAPVVVAVADFDNQTGDPGLDGLSGMLITSLEQSRGLSVLTRSRMFDLARQAGHADAATIDERLGREVAQKAQAQALLLATLRKFDEMYVVDLKVLDPQRNTYAAAISEQARGKGSVPRLIDKLSAAAKRALKDVQQEGAKPIEDVTTQNLAAYQHYFRGEEAVDRLQFAQAADHYRQAIAIDEGFALAWYRLAYALMWMHDGVRGRAAIDRALSGESRMPPKELLLARGVRGSLYSKGGEAYEAYKECTERWPAEKECAFMLADLLFHGGYFQLSVPGFASALALDPAMERAHQHLVWVNQILGDDDAMIAAAQAWLREGADKEEASGGLARAQAAAGRMPEAKATLAKAAEILPGSALLAADRAALLAWDYDVDGAVAALLPALQKRRSPRERLVAQLTLAGALVQGGRVHEAVLAYEAAASAARQDRDPEAEANALTGQALTLLLYLRDAAGARRIAKDAVARGLPESNFAFLYPLLGDIDDYGRVLRSAGDPMADLSVSAFTANAAGNPGKAAEQIDALAERSPYRDFVRYAAADAWMRAGENGKAIEGFVRAQKTFPSTTGPGPGFAGLFRARSNLQLAALYERVGQTQASADLTRRFLAAWSKADKDLPELREGRDRLARLAGGGPLR
jgi:tetratricopeptide (TPR) repeat protein